MRWLTRSVLNLTAFRFITTGWREGTKIWFERTENDDLIVETSICSWATTGVYKKFAWPNELTLRKIGASQIILAN